MGANKYKIVNRTRFIVSVVLLTLLFIIVFSLITNTYKTYAIKESQYFEVIVTSGDTVWDIAKEYRNENQDVRELVYIILEVNKIENSIIHEEQKLKIPVN